MSSQGLFFGDGWAPWNHISLVYEGGQYESTHDPRIAPMTRAELILAAQQGDAVVTATARLGPNSDVEHPQPALWLPPLRPNQQTSLQKMPVLTSMPTLTLFGRHVVDGAIVLVNGRAVAGDVVCETGGDLPACDDERLRIDLAQLPPVGNHTIQLATPGGLLSNEVLLLVR